MRFSWLVFLVTYHAIAVDVSAQERCKATCCQELEKLARFVFRDVELGSQAQREQLKIARSVTDLLIRVRILEVKVARMSQKESSQKTVIKSDDLTDPRSKVRDPEAQGKPDPGAESDFEEYER
ncbi:MAG: hypothetical protein OXR72_01750 [Gemmatimonadota bacterium]|nr:hypothetical protein [Gemmatimonadota bacterium]